jgi:hypothetical protein
VRDRAGGRGSIGQDGEAINKDGSAVGDAEEDYGGSNLTLFFSFSWIDHQSGQLMSQ